MHQKNGGTPPPKSNDLEGWREAIRAGRLPAFRLEEIAAAFQDLRPLKDQAVEHALIKYLSDSVTTMLYGQVSALDPNGGEDFVFRAHAQIIEALLKPKSADGKNLRVAFASRVFFRLKDAIAVERRLGRLADPDEDKKRPPQERGKKSKEPKGFELAYAEAPGESDDEQAEGAETGKRPTNPALMDAIKRADQEVDVRRFIERHIPDWQKRLAFRLHMDGVPYKSKKGLSIAKALGISDKTAGTWVREAIDILEAALGELT